MIVTFDYDNTLCAPISMEGMWYGDGVTPNERIIKKLREHEEASDIIAIVTARIQLPDNEEQIANFIRVHRLPIITVRFTNDELKVDILKELGSELHYDDNEQEIEACTEAGINCVLVLHPLTQIESIQKYKTI